MKKRTKLDKLYEDIDNAYGGFTPEQMKEAIKEIEQEVAKSQATLEKMEKAPEDKKEDMKKKIAELENKIINMSRYSKNKTQIAKIQQYKGSLELKLIKVTEENKTAEANLKKMILKYKEVVKKLQDEKYTMTLDGNKYNALLEKKETLFNEIKENTILKIKSAERIMELKGKIGKWDLAWKTLFTGKDWDEIQRRAVSDKRFVRRVDEKHPPIKGDKAQAELLLVKAEIAKNVQEIMQEEKGRTKEGGHAPVPAKVSTWQKIKNWFKGKFGKNMPEKGEQTNSERDEFLEGLRQHVDLEYRKKVREEKAQLYIDQHKAKESEESER